jgi:superfamily II DNA/RNA helicase
MTEKLSPNGAPRQKRQRTDRARPFGGNHNGGSGSGGSQQGRPGGQRPRSPQTSQSPVAPLVRTPVPATPARVLTGNESFADFGVPQPIIDSLTYQGITSPFPIQAATLTDALAGRDVLGRGQTGSGKTIAFAIPTVVALVNSGKQRQPFRPRAMILVPTRELANQVADTVKPLAHAMGLRLTTVYGGVSQHGQVSALRSGVDIVIACPGRLEDLIQQDLCRLTNVEITVLDEADHMADLGFLPGVKRLLEATPKNGQRLLFSATLDNAIDVLVDRFLSNPIVHSVAPAVASVDTMTHHVFAISTTDKGTITRELASGKDRVLLFMRTKHGAKKMAQHLTKSGIPSVDLHGNLSQNARERNLASFSSGTTKVLVATDIAARGIHVDDVALVVHVDPPTEHKAYLHRSGRTARAGSDGIVITLMTPDQTGDVKSLAKAAKIDPTITKITPGHALIAEIVGEAAEFVTPAAAPATAPLSKPSRPPKGHTRRPLGDGGPQRAIAREGQPSAGRPAQGSGRPAQGSGQGRPAQGSGRPAQGSGQGRPAQGSGQGRPAQGSGQGRPAQGSGQGRPASGQPSDAGNARNAAKRKATARRFA